MLLRLKDFAIRAYGLQPDRVRAFATATAEKKRLVCVLQSEKRQAGCSVLSMTVSPALLSWILGSATRCFVSRAAS